LRQKQFLNNNKNNNQKKSLHATTMKSNILILASLITAISALPAQDITPVQPEAITPVQPEAIQKWQDARFGMFIHWGPVSLKGTEIGWSRGGQVPTEEYDNLYKQFNPAKFNADEWVAIAKAAGMKYMVLTTKHHDGFCLWDTKQTDYNIMNTPFKRDVVKELAEACKKGGIAFGTDPQAAARVITAARRATKLPLIPKLSPNVSDIRLFARVAQPGRRPVRVPPGGARMREAPARLRPRRARPPAPQDAHPKPEPPQVATERAHRARAASAARACGPETMMVLYLRHSTASHVPASA
jgi:hypothetical protein